MAALLPDLTLAQQNALDFVYRKALYNKKHSFQRLEAVLAASSVRCEAYDLIDTIYRRARLTINFHPDRLLSNGRSVIAGLYEDGIYRSQFETKISNGGLTAFSGGDRDRWEEAMFGSAYQAQGVTEAEHPKYGGLNLMNYSDGACPRFGSCHVRLKQDTLRCSTFTFGDSASNPKECGMIDVCEAVVAGFLEEIVRSGNALGRTGVYVASFVNALLSLDTQSEHVFFRPSQGRALNTYIEAQIHGELNLATDVDALVADPSFQGNATSDLLKATAEKYHFCLEWHPGFELTLVDVAEVPEDFRGSEMLPLAKRVMENHAVDSEHLDAAAIGLAAASVVVNPEKWKDWGRAKDTLQQLKYLWHVLVAYGKPRAIID